MSHYHAFGLKLDSQIELPELQRGTGPGDVVIRRSAVPRADGEATAGWLQGGGDRLVLRLDDITFIVEGGRSIEIAAPAGTPDNDIRVWLLGTVMAALLHQRGYFCIHANLIRLPGGGVAAFCGLSGAGKSTLAALLDRAGFEVLGDDLCAARIDASQGPHVYRGIPRLKLWEDALALLGLSRAGLEKVGSAFDKFHVPLASVAAVGELTPLSLERLYLLDRREEADDALVVPVTGLRQPGSCSTIVFAGTSAKVLPGAIRAPSSTRLWRSPGALPCSASPGGGARIISVTKSMRLLCI